MPRTNMRDVARDAEVSVATVSHVINNTRFVAEETRVRVLQSINKLGYLPDAMARSFKTGRRNLIGFIVPDIANEFFSTIIEEIEGVISHENYKLVVSNTKESRRREIENLRVLSGGIVDGLIIASTLESYTELAHMLPPELPAVFIDRTLPGCPCDTITVANYRAIYQGVEKLILSGHRRIGYIMGLPRLSTTAERLAAYRAAMDDYHVPIEHGFVQVGDSMSKSALLHLEKLLELNCTALVVSNNVMADDVLFYLSERGIRAGADLEIVGYCDGPHAHFNMRHIHVVSQPVVELGRAAGQQLLERISTPGLPIRQTVLQSVFQPHP